MIQKYRSLYSLKKVCQFYFVLISLIYHNDMDIQIENTPPKKTTPLDYPSTPPHKFQLADSYNTPVKKKAPQMLTPVKPSGENPESKKLKITSEMKGSCGSSSKKVSQFSISRLDQDYLYERKLGEGNFSSVGLYRSRMTGDLFAIKVTKTSTMSVNEVQALGTLSIFSQKSKNIIRYYHSWIENSELYLVMEYCNQSFSSIISNKRKIKVQFFQSTMKDILKQSLQGLKCMHENRMVHLDIKPDNILFKDSVLKISDLGLTRLNNLKRQSELEEGDSRYLAKEVLNYYPGVDLTKSDIFSLGMAIYEAISLEELPNNGEYWRAIRENGLHLRDRMDLQDYCGELLAIIEAMTNPHWQNRPSAASILSSNYFKEGSGRKSRLLANHKFQHKERKNESSL